MKNKFFACILLLLGLGLLPLQAQNDDPKVVIPKFIDQWVCDSILNFWTGVSFPSKPTGIYVTQAPKHVESDTVTLTMYGDFVLSADSIENVKIFPDNGSCDFTSTLLGMQEGWCYRAVVAPPQFYIDMCSAADGPVYFFSKKTNVGINQHQAQQPTNVLQPKVQLLLGQQLLIDAGNKTTIKAVNFQNALGQFVAHKTFSQINKTIIDLNSLQVSNGVYFVQIVTENGRFKHIKPILIY